MRRGFGTIVLHYTWRNVGCYNVFFFKSAAWRKGITSDIDLFQWNSTASCYCHSSVPSRYLWSQTAPHSLWNWLIYCNDDARCAIYITRPSLCAQAMNNTLEAIATDVPDIDCNQQYAPIAIVSVMLFFSAFTIGWGPIPGILLGELLPLRVRGVSSGIS